MLSNNNNDKNTNNHKLKNEFDRDEILLNNKEIINTLILENTQKKDKSFISIKELEIIKDFESNLIKLLEKCPPKILKEIISETTAIDSLGKFYNKDL